MGKNPVVMETGDHILEVVQIHRFGKERVSADVVGQADIVDTLRSGEDDNNQFLKARVGFNPTEDRKPVHPRHFEVQKDNGGIGIVTGKIVHRLAPAAADVHRVLHADLLESTKKQVDIVGRIVNKQDCSQPGHYTAQ